MTPTEFRTAREQLALTQGQLAAILDVDRAHVSRIETGAKAITMQTALLMRAMTRFGLPDVWPEG